ncbi:MAG: hypothetical protein IPG71_00320 [bacterium]|nr:hypothetical protein [bacterium]
MILHDPTPNCTDESAGAALLHYALGTLSHEKMQFEEHLIECAGCQHELDKHRTTLAAMSSNRPELLDNLRKRSDRVRVARKQMYVLSTAALAVAACVIALLVWPKKQDNVVVVPTAGDSSLVDKDTVSVESELTNDSLMVPPHTPPSIAHLAVFAPLAYSPINVRAAETDARSIFREGMERYQVGQFAEALIELKRAHEADTTDTEIGLFTGVTAGITGKIDLARSVLAQALRQNPRPARVAQLKWYLAQVAIARDDRKAAMTLLDDLAAGESAYRTDAKDMASKLARE